MSAASLLALAACLAPPQEAPATPVPARPVFVEHPEIGELFVHRRFTTPTKKYLPETAGSGIALADWDGDGDLDLYCVQCAPLPGYPGTEPAPPDVLLRNEGGFRFTVVPDEWDAEVVAADGTRSVVRRKLGLGDRRYGMGASAPDVDNDGWPDLFVTNLGQSALYRNNRDGTFTDVTAGSGIGAEDWPAAAAFADLDRDGDLDLYLANYSRLDYANYVVCGSAGKPSYCHPDTLESAPDRLYRNDGGFRFTDISAEAGIVEADEGGKGLAVLPFDQDGDGDLDLYVANDADPNYLWINQGGMKFVEEAGWWGVAVSGRGSSQSCMGSDLADVDGDLDLDLFSTNFAKEPNVLYVRGPDGFYDDRSYPSGLGEPSYLSVGFGTRFFDHDRDGDPDVMVVNGHIVDDAHVHDPQQEFEQVPHFYVNRGDGTFEQVGPRLSPFFTRKNLGRGLAIGDLDDDGDVDVVVAENDHALAVLENVPAESRRWIGLELVGTRSPRDAIGATVVIDCIGRRQLQTVLPMASYLSWSDRRLFFGLGTPAAGATVTAEIRWPSGRAQKVAGLALDRYHRIEEPAK